MKIGEVLFFIANITVVYSISLSQNKPSETASLKNEEILKSKYDEDCSRSSKNICENNVTDYIENCETLNLKNISNEANVVECACSIVKSILTVVCVNKRNISDFLKRENASSFCPFNLTHIENLNFTISNNELIKKFIKPEHCSKECIHLTPAKTQCVVLNKFNNDLKHTDLFILQVNSTTEVIGEPSANSAHPEAVIQKTENSMISTSQNKQRLLRKDNTKEKRVEATNVESNTSQIKLMNEEKKTENFVGSTPLGELKATKKTKMPENIVKISEKKNILPENNELKPKIEDSDEDDLNSKSSINHLFTIRTDFGQTASKLSKLENPEVRIDSSKGQEIYSEKDFFQAEDSHFFFYFIMVSSVIVVAYLAFHNKNKILAYVLEGTSGRRSRRRPNPARYRKLETNLEEVISSNATSAASSSIVY